MPVSERPSEISITKALEIFNMLAMTAIDRKFEKDMQDEISERLVPLMNT